MDLGQEKNNMTLEEKIKDILREIGENPDREGLKETPARVVKMYKEIFRGYDEKTKPKITTFSNENDKVSYDQIIYDTGYFFSHCEHHMVPFFGQYHFAYIPGNRIVGLSKVARIVDWHSAKLQIQERLVKDIVDDLEYALGNPVAIGLIMKGRHLCKEMRGVKKFNGAMITSDMRGAFRTKPEARAEFLKLTQI